MDGAFYDIGNGRIELYLGNKCMAACNSQQAMDAVVHLLGIDKEAKSFPRHKGER